MSPLALLGIVPIWVWALIASVGWGTWEHQHAAAAKRDLAEYKLEAQAKFDQQRAADAAETARLLREKQENIDVATKETAANRAAADAARVALDRLRARYAAGGHAGTGTATTTPGCAPATTANLVPADMLVRCGERVVGLAEFADASRTAGKACERAYDALKQP